MTARWSATVYLGVWLVLSAAQGWALTGGAGSAAAAAAVVVVAQLLKALAAIPRLNDLGEPPDDAMMGVVPLVSIGLFMRLTQGTPTPAQWDERRATWVHERLALGQFARGASTILRAPGPVLTVVVPAVAVAVWIELWATDRLLRLPSEMSDGGQGLGQALVGLTGLFLLVTLIQFVKPKTRRTAWWPALMILPTGFLAGAASLGGSTLDLANVQGPLQGNAQFVPYILGSNATVLYHQLLVGPAVALMWTALAHADHLGKPGADVIATVKSRWFDVLVPHGASLLIIALGLQIIVPGVVYMLHFAFVLPVALLEPDQPALRRSTDLTRPIRRRIFKVFLLGFLAEVVLFAIAVLAMEPLLSGSADIGTRLVSAGSYLMRLLPGSAVGLHPATVAVINLGNALAWGASAVALTHMYLERTSKLAVTE
jgi:hypothetical protein